VKHGGRDFRLAKDDKEAHDIWHDRKNAHDSGPSLAPGAKGWVTDVWCVFEITRLSFLV
jgi:D-lactate dehydrogenase (cytochrome)